MLIWVILIILNFFAEKKEFSEQENRFLAKLPKFNIGSLAYGSYQEDLDNYINDHLVFRDLWLKMNSGFEKILRKDGKQQCIYRKRRLFI